MGKLSVCSITLESTESLGMSGKEVIDKEGESSVVIKPTFSTWGLIISFSIASLINLLIPLLLVEFPTLITANLLDESSSKKKTSQGVISLLFLRSSSR